jgi:carboxypeptidase family protein
VNAAHTALARALLLLVSVPGSICAQVPTGTVTGVVTDPTGAAVANARVTIADPETGQTWTLHTSPEGIYTAAALSPGQYRVTVEAPGFARIDVGAGVEAGTTTSVDLALEVAAVSSSVTVRGAVPLLHFDHHQIGAVVRREQIENVPLNGRNVLELAKLEPGVTSPVRGLTANRTFIATLGAGLQTIPRLGYTRVTVDGASINAFGVIGTSLQISPDIIEEFQLSTVNFDATTSLTTNGAVNVVTRSGGNDYHATGFAFYRDHHLAAYPGLRRDPRNPHPFFERGQIGGSAGGPLMRTRMFFHGGYERVHQQGVASVQPGAPDFAPLGGVFGTPSNGYLVSARVDGRLPKGHALAVRHSHDASTAFGPVAGVLPSGWTNQPNRASQSVISLTSPWRADLVSDLRWSYFALDSRASAPDSHTCAGCFGLGAPRITVSGTGLTFGTSPNLFSLAGRRHQVSDSVIWQRGRHRLRAGIDWEHSTVRSAVPDADRLVMTLWSPQRVRQTNPPGAPTGLPASFTTVDDLLQLPLQSFELSIGPGAALERGFRRHRTLDLYRIHVADTWRVGASLTLNAGIGWSYEPNALNDDLTKPALLGPLVGERGLDAPAARRGVSPTLGFAWAATPDGRTVVRAGIGRYFDPAGSTNSTNLANERLLLSPLGTGRLTISGSNLRRNGVPLSFLQQPTAFTARDLLTILPGIRAELAAALDADNRDFSVRNINRTKEGTNLYDAAYAVPSAVHVSLGVQRELARDFVLSADAVWKRFAHAFINGIDYNRFNSAQGPVIPRCGDAQREQLGAICSNGPIMFDTTIGRARYTGLILRAEKRVPGRAQLVASYAVGSLTGTNGTGTGTAEMGSGRATGFNNDDWFENDGPVPTDLRHILNVSGYLELPARFQVAINMSATSRPPFTAWLENVDINGDGTNDDLLPGTTVNDFGRGLDADDLQRLVDAYNERWSGTALCCGQTAPRVTLPATYRFNDTFFTQDLRITHKVPLSGRRARIAVFGEVFNLFNTANLVQYSGNLLEPATFGQPGGRFTQLFGSGGPRAFQLGARVSF